MRMLALGVAVLAGGVMVHAGIASRPGSAGHPESLAARESASALVARDGPIAPAGDFVWTKLPAEPYRGKQDDIFFLSPTTGWYVNGLGRIYATTDAGNTWTKRFEQPGTYFRCIAFLDEQRGFAGNIGTDYFPGVTDTHPLYATTDGGATWNIVPTDGDPLSGLCALEVVREPFINAGVLDHKTLLVGVGRVGGPAVFVRSDDEGKTWNASDLAQHAGMALDVHFFDRQNGILAAATNPRVEESNALILRTEDGGTTWTEVYRSQRPFELTWKISFPTRDVGYVTIQSYNPDPAASARFIAKTTDGGKTWTELPLVDDAKVRTFGIGFTDEMTGWVGAMPGGFFTKDGGATWTPADMGPAVNKIRTLKTDTGWTGYAIGVEVRRLDPAGAAGAK